MTAKKVDANQTAIVDARRECGCKVLSLASLGKGAPDLLVECPSGKLYLLEVKTAHGKLTHDQLDFHRQWPVMIVHNEIEALRAVGCVMQDSDI